MSDSFARQTDIARRVYQQTQNQIDSLDTGLFQLDILELTDEIAETKTAIEKAEQLLLLKVQALHQAKRLAELEKREANMNSIPGDFDGNVTGKWKKLDDSGAGVVTYNDKEYLTQPLGFTSLPSGTEVELSHADGKYFSKF